MSMPTITHDSDRIFASLPCLCALNTGATNRSGYTKTSAQCVRNVLSDGLTNPRGNQATRSGPKVSSTSKLYRGSLIERYKRIKYTRPRSMRRGSCWARGILHIAPPFPGRRSWTACVENTAQISNLRIQFDLVSPAKSISYLRAQLLTRTD
jgi:hypothetical protein